MRLSGIGRSSKARATSGEWSIANRSARCVCVCEGACVKAPVSVCLSICHILPVLHGWQSFLPSQTRDGRRERRYVARRRQLEDGLAGPSEPDAREPGMGSITDVRRQTTRPSSSASCTSSSTAAASTTTTAASCQAACAPSWWIHHAGVVRAAAAALHDAPRCAPR